MSSTILAFGIFFTLSCSNLQQTESTGQQGSDSKSIEQQIKRVNQRLANNPDNSRLQSEKARLLYTYSQTLSNPAQRKPVYQNIRDLSASSTDSDKSIRNILVKAWRDEQTAGISLLHEDQGEKTDRPEQEFSTIVAHFENAITLLPDSLKSYNLLATTHYQHGNLKKAISTLESAEEQVEKPTPDIEEKLAYLYLESGDLAEAEIRYRQLVVSYPDKLLYKHGLVNVLIVSGKHEETIKTLEELSDEYPSRYNYRESLATELYYLFKKRTDTYLQANESKEVTQSDYKEISDLLENIHSIFETLEETVPSTEDNLFRMATFYKKASFRLKELSSVNSDISFSDLQQEYMEYSLPLWEQLAELKPDNLGYLSNLYEVYVELDMKNEAENLERSYNF